MQARSSSAHRKQSGDRLKSWHYVDFIEIHNFLFQMNVCKEEENFKAFTRAIIFSNETSENLYFHSCFKFRLVIHMAC